MLYRERKRLVIGDKKNLFLPDKYKFIYSRRHSFRYKHSLYTKASFGIDNRRNRIYRYFRIRHVNTSPRGAEYVFSSPHRKKKKKTILGKFSKKYKKKTQRS